MLRYIGVEVGEGLYDSEEAASSRSKVVFEWRLEGPEGVRHEIVSPLCRDVVRRGVPAPDCARRVQVSVLTGTTTHSWGTSCAHFLRTFPAHIFCAHFLRTVPAA